MTSQTITRCVKCNQPTVRDGGRCNWCGYHASDKPTCALCNDTGCPACTGAWPNPSDQRFVCKGCGKRRSRPVAHNTAGVLCGPWVGPRGDWSHA